MNIQKSVVSINPNNNQLGKCSGRKDLIYNAVHCEKEIEEDREYLETNLHVHFRANKNK